MKTDKRTENLNSRPVRPICVGKSAVLTKNGTLYRTFPVIALHQYTSDYIHFETQDAHYHLSFSPYPFATAAMQAPLPLAA